MKIDEGEYQRALEVALNAPLRPTRAHRQNSGSVVLAGKWGKRRIILGPSGSGDLVVLVRGGAPYCEVEAKARKGKERKSQLARARFLELWGCVYVVARPEVDDLDEAVRAGVAKIDAAIAAWGEGRS